MRPENKTKIFFFVFEKKKKYAKFYNFRIEFQFKKENKTNSKINAVAYNDKITT